MELWAGQASHLKLRRLTTKYRLKRAVRDLLPATGVDPLKHGLGVPSDRWLPGARAS
jgi:hypothetical protein